MPNVKEAKIVKGSDRKLRLENFYTPLEEAKKEIWRRWNDKELRKKVEDFLGGDIPKPIKTEPKAVLLRNIATPDNELFHFVELSKRMKLKPLVLEYVEDKFVAECSDKYHICKLFFHNGKGKNGGDKVSTLRIVDFNKYEGKNFNKMKTQWGEDFVNFHHRILLSSSLMNKESFFDTSDWVHKKGNSAKKYYKYLLAFFLCHGVLFETFLTNDPEEMEFNRNIVVPSFNAIYKNLGIKPLVVPLMPLDDEDNLFWWCYPEKIKLAMRVMAVLI